MEKFFSVGRLRFIREERSYDEIAFEAIVITKKLAYLQKGDLFAVVEGSRQAQSVHSSGLSISLYHYSFNNRSLHQVFC